MCFIMKISVSSSLKLYMTYGTNRVHHLMAEYKGIRHKPITANNSQMTGLYLIHLTKIKVQLKEIEQRKFQ